MLCSFFLISVYLVLIIAEHPECPGFGEDPPNITDKFDFAYKLGFSVLAVQFVNSSVINVALRLKVAREENHGRVK